LPDQTIKQLSKETTEETGIFLVNTLSLTEGTYSGEDMVKYPDDFLDRFSNMNMWYDNGINKLYENKN
jgi:hypothetical protein